MEAEVKEYVKSCHDCQTRKLLQLPKAGLLQPIAVGRPFEKVGIDLLGPFPRSENGNKFIIVATDYFTKYVITKALPDGSALEVAKFFLEDIVCKQEHLVSWSVIAALPSCLNWRRRFTTCSTLDT